jgi:peptide/nickel transport system ATP-binding protein
MVDSSAAHLRDDDHALLRVEDLTVEFGAGRGRRVHAVSGITFDVLAGETLSLVGESGCGKSTTGRAIVQLPPPTRGRVLYDGDDLAKMSKIQLKKVRPRIQMIYQDPISSLNPRRTIGRVIDEPLRVWRTGDNKSRGRAVDEILEAVGLDPSAKSRRPYEFSGGQCQRICIARALVLDPDLVICDEPVSALDVSVQAQILNLLEEMKERYGLTLIFISHDLAVVRNVSDRVAVMYLGKLCEIGPPEDLYDAPAHPYTAALMDAAPVADPDAPVRQNRALTGELPSPLAPPSGCRFRTRCEYATERCTNEEPLLRPVGPGQDHFVACHHPLVETGDPEAP